MKQDTFILKDKNQIREVIIEKCEGFFGNLLSLKDSYALSMLYRVLQSDVLAVLVGEEISSEEISFLKENQSYVCVISINNAWKSLLENDIIPNFIMGELNGEYDERLNKVAIIENIEHINPLLALHKGKKFFYWTEVSLLKHICEEAQKKSDYVYQYNIFEKIPIFENIYEQAIYIAKYLNAENILVIGTKENGICTNLDSRVLVNKHDNMSLNKVKEMYHVECRIDEILEVLIPLFDEKGKEAYHDILENIIEEIRVDIANINKTIELYSQLYNIAVGKYTGTKEIGELVKDINSYTEKLDRSSVSFYTTKLVNELQVGRFVDEIFSPNEVSEIALDGICMLKKMQIVDAYFESAILEVSNNCCSKAGTESECVKERTIHPTILIVYESSQYDKYFGMVKGLKCGFQSLGYTVYLWDGCGISVCGYNIYQNTVGYDYIILLNGVLCEQMFVVQSSGCLRLWYDNVNTKVVNIFVEHPKRHYDKLKHIRKNINAVYSDLHYCEYVQKYVKSLSRVFYLPLGGFCEGENISFEEKDNKLVFFGDRVNLIEIENKINESEYREFIWKIIGELISNSDNTIEDTMRQIGKENNCLFSVEQILIYRDVYNLVETYLIEYFKKKIVIEIAQSGIPIDIYGLWDEEIIQYENVTYKDKVNFEEMINICKKTRFVLSMQLWQKDGIQESVINAMLGESVVITEYSDSISHTFVDEQSALLYKLGELEKLPQKILYYMEKTGKAEEIAKRGFKIASEKHTWLQYAENLMELIS